MVNVWSPAPHQLGGDAQPRRPEIAQTDQSGYSTRSHGSIVKRHHPPHFAKMFSSFIISSSCGPKKMSSLDVKLSNILNAFSGEDSKTAHFGTLHGSEVSRMNALSRSQQSIRRCMGVGLDADAFSSQSLSIMIYLGAYLGLSSAV